MGIFMSIGKAGTYTSSCKWKLNNKSFTKPELIAIEDAMDQILWTRHFLASQGDNNNLLACINPISLYIQHTGGNKQNHFCRMSNNASRINIIFSDQMNL